MMTETNIENSRKYDCSPFDVETTKQTRVVVCQDHVFRYLSARNNKEQCEHEHCMKEFDSKEDYGTYIDENNVNFSFYQILLLQYQKYSQYSRISSHKDSKKRILVTVI